MSFLPKKKVPKGEKLSSRTARPESRYKQQQRLDRLGGGNGEPYVSEPPIRMADYGLIPRGVPDAGGGIKPLIPDKPIIVATNPIRQPRIPAANQQVVLEFKGIPNNANPIAVQVVQPSTGKVQVVNRKVTPILEQAHQGTTLELIEYQKIAERMIYELTQQLYKDPTDRKIENAIQILEEVKRTSNVDTLSVSQLANIAARSNSIVSVIQPYLSNPRFAKDFTTIVQAARERAKKINPKQAVLELMIDPVCSRLTSQVNHFGAIAGWLSSSMLSVLGWFHMLLNFIPGPVGIIISALMSIMIWTYRIVFYAEFLLLGWEAFLGEGFTTIWIFGWGRTVTNWLHNIFTTWEHHSWTGPNAPGTLKSIFNLLDYTSLYDPKIPGHLPLNTPLTFRAIYKPYLTLIKTAGWTLGTHVPKNIN